MDIGSECSVVLPAPISLVPDVLTISWARRRRALVGLVIGVGESKLETDEEEAVEAVDERRPRPGMGVGGTRRTLTLLVVGAGLEGLLCSIGDTEADERDEVVPILEPDSIGCSDAKIGL
jgi:hypothetical protein